MMLDDIGTDKNEQISKQEFIIFLKDWW